MMKPSKMIKQRFCELCIESDSYCEHCCIVRDIIDALEDEEEKNESKNKKK